MRTKSLKYLFLLSTVFLAASCSGGGSTPTHEHHFGEWTVDKAATCVAKGIRSHTCTECGAVESEEIPIDPNGHEWGEWKVTTPATCLAPAIETRVCEYCSDHTETREGKGPIEHHYVLLAEGEFKKEYEIGETFLTTGMTVYKVCTSGCGFKEEYTDGYTIQYQGGEGQTSFKGGDTKVYLEATEDDLSGEIDVVVNLKKNAIIGIEDTAELHCKEELDLTDVTCTSGDTVNVKYYSDKDCTKVITKDNLIAGADGKEKVYYAKIVSSGLNPDYEIAEKVVELTVSHDLVDTANLNVIGYAKSDCVCGYHTEDTNLMTDELCIFEATASSGAAKTTWGGTYNVIYSDISPISWVGPNLQVNHTLVYVQDNPRTGTEKEKVINLPKVNYSLYNKVTFVCAQDSNTKFPIQFKVGDAEVLPSQLRENYNFEVTYVPAAQGLGKIKVVGYDLTNNVQTATEILIDDPDIVTGVKSLALTSIDAREASVSHYSRAGIFRILLNHTCSKEDATAVADTNVIGYKNLVCNKCHKMFGKSDEVMAATDVDFVKNFYGANMAYSAGQSHPEEAKYEVAHQAHSNPRYNGILYKADYVSSGSETIDYLQRYDIGLPKVNYKAYEKVEFDLSSEASGWVTFTFQNVTSTTAKTTSDKKSGIHITVTKNADASYVLTVSSYDEGVTPFTDPFEGKSYALTANEINGTDSVSCISIQTIRSGSPLKALPRSCFLHEIILTPLS